MDRELITARISRLATDAGTNWLKAVDRLTEHESAATLPVPKLAAAVADALSEAIDRTLAQVTAELAKNVTRSSRNWGWAHDEAVRIFDEKARYYFASIGGLIGQPEETALRITGGKRDLMLSHIAAVMALHESGWSSPPMEPWLKRHGHWVSLAMSAAALLVSIFGDDVRDAVLGSPHSSSHPGIESHPSPGTLTSPAGER